jgi:HEAT repeat protein
MKNLPPKLIALLLLALGAGFGPGAEARAQEEEDVDWSITNQSYEVLFYQATRYGNTEDRRKEKASARAELFRRGPDALREVMNRVHLENTMLQVLALEMVRDQVPAPLGAPVLLEFLNHERPETRKAAVLFLGYYPAAPEPERLLVYLDDDKTRGAAIRTLGKWKVEDARPKIARLLDKSDSERVRIACANALRDIGNEEDLPVLISALGDPVFTVRNTAARAVASFGRAAHRPLLKALEDARGPARRQIVRLLGELDVGAAARPVRRLLERPDPALRADAARALRQIDPGPAERWLRDVTVDRVDAEPLFRAP